MKPTDLFSNLSDFQTYTDGLVADTTYAQLAPSIRTVVLSVMPLITANVYVALAQAAAFPNQNEGKTEEEIAANEILLEGKELLKTAVAAGAMLKYQIFSSVKKNGSDASLYKYQHEEIKDSYAEAYWLAMDRLLDFLDDNPKIGDYDQTTEYTDRQALPVKTGREFDRYYGIGGSAFFFHKVLFLALRRETHAPGSSVRGDAGAGEGGPLLQGRRPGRHAVRRHRAPALHPLGL